MYHKLEGPDFRRRPLEIHEPLMNLYSLTQEEQQWIWFAATGAIVPIKPELVLYYDSINILSRYSAISINYKFNVSWWEFERLRGDVLRWHPIHGQAEILAFFIQKGWLDISNKCTIDHWRKHRKKELEIPIGQANNLSLRIKGIKR